MKKVAKSPYLHHRQVLRNDLPQLFVCVYAYNITQVQQYLLAVSLPQLTAPPKYLFNGVILLRVFVELGMVSSLVIEYSTHHGSLMLWYRLTKLKL